MISSFCNKKKFPIFVQMKIGNFYFVILPDFRLYCCFFNVQTFHISFHKYIKAFHTFRLWIQSTSLISGKHPAVQEVRKSLSLFFIDQIGSQKSNSPRRRPLLLFP